MRTILAIIIVVGSLLICAIGSRATSDVPSNNVQIFAPNGKLTEAITSKGYKDMTNWRVWRMTSSTAWKRKHTATAGGSGTWVDVPAGVTELGVSKITPFTHYTSVTGTLEGM